MADTAFRPPAVKRAHGPTEYRGGEIGDAFHDGGNAHLPRWCADTGLSVVQVDREGRRISVTGPEHSTPDARLLRAQAFAGEGGPNEATGLLITKALLAVKLDGQARNAEHVLNNPSAAALIREYAEQVQHAPSVDDARSWEGAAAGAYWQAWTHAGVAPRFDPGDVFKLPGHWTRGFTDRMSELGQKARHATDPVNAALNYAYRLAETECRLAALTLGLDPTMGFLHLDAPGRDSLALDLMETIRPTVDRYVLAVLGHSARADTADGYAPATWFTETREGVCRLVAPLTHQIAEQAAVWAREVAAHALTLTRTLAATGKGQITTTLPRAKRRKPAGKRPAGSKPDGSVPLAGPVTAERIIPDDLWDQLAPLVPPVSAPGRGAPSADHRALLAALVCVELLGTAWVKIPHTLEVSRRTCRSRLDRWEAMGTWDTVRTMIENHPHYRTLAEEAAATANARRHH